MRTRWYGPISRTYGRGCALLFVTLTILAGCASLPSASGVPVTAIDQIAGKWVGTINPGHNSFVDPFYLTITPDGKLVAGWGVDTSWGTVTLRNGQATFEMQPPIAEGTIRLYDDGGRRTLIMDGISPSFTAQVTPQR
jgi:uncharacterized protein YndB with AHSA1/START domain